MANYTGITGLPGDEARGCEAYTHRMGTLVDITGRRFERLLVLEQAGRNTLGEVLWRCQCECGAIRTLPGGRLKIGDTKSCGCAHPRRQPKPRRLSNLLYGYRWTDAGMVVDALGALHVRQIDAFHSQGLTLQAITLTMNAGDGKAWTITTVVRILGNLHLYRGGRRGKHDATWPPILAADDGAGEP